MTIVHQRSSVIPDHERQKELVADLKVPQILPEEREEDYRIRLIEKQNAFCLIPRRQRTPLQEAFIELMDQEIKESLRRKPLAPQDFENAGRSMVRSILMDFSSR